MCAVFNYEVCAMLVAFVDVYEVMCILRSNRVPRVLRYRCGLCVEDFYSEPRAAKNRGTLVVPGPGFM